MTDFQEIFEHLPAYRIIQCKRHRYAVPPAQVKRHLATHHAELSQDRRRSIVAAVVECPQLAQTPSEVVYPEPEGDPIEGFPTHHNGLRCSGKDRSGLHCPHVFQTTYRIQEHCKEQHQWVNEQKRGGHSRLKEKQSPNRLWETGCSYQQFFRVPCWKRCFQVGRHSPVVEQSRETQPCEGRSLQISSFFHQQEENLQQCKREAVALASRVQGFNDHRSTVIPWLRTTGIVEHIQGLDKEEIKASMALPQDGEGPLSVILTFMQEILQEAHSWCFDGPNCMLTWPCRVVLNRFQSSQVELFGKTRGFDPYKLPSTLASNFRQWKQFLVYVSRVGFGEDHFFTASPGESNPQRPEDVIELTEQQRRAWRILWQLAERQAEGRFAEAASGMKEGLTEFCMLLVCHQTGARRYRSPLVSFCAMLSIRQATLGWMSPGDLNSYLSGVIWVVQLLVFYDCAQRERNGQGKTLQLVKRRCEKYLQQTAETAIGEVLRWRLLLFKVSREEVSARQAIWDEREQVLTYGDTELHMDHIPKLLLSEYEECRRLLYADLMFGASDFRCMHAHSLKDQYDVDVVGWNFIQHRDNRRYLEGTEQYLLKTIQISNRLCKLFLAKDVSKPSGYAWRQSAITSYETAVQAFLERFAAINHISNGTPVREGEFLSMTYKNTQRRRSVSLQHGRVMIHITYHKGQQQTGTYKNNIRFLAEPIANMLLDYIVYVLPLRQIFLRQSSPNALLSPFLWEKKGKVWSDGKLSRCLENASARAQIPRLHVSNWRQMTVAIVKTKFAKDVACFEAESDDSDGEEVDHDIRLLTKQRNHTTRTVNRAYANQTGATFGNVWDGLIRMGLRASTLWQNFWGVETILKGKKRVRIDSESRLTKQIAMGVYRPKKAWSSDALLRAARQLFQDDGMMWKSMEQEQALTAIMSWAEQIVVILPTGAGKSLLFMLPCTLPEAGITVLVVPLIALRLDLIRRLQGLGIDYLVWLPGERREAALVLVTIEAACSSDFLAYAQGLVAQQKLDRVVFEECHLTITAARYRPAMEKVSITRTLRTQFVYLTATLPPTMQSEFEQQNFLMRPMTIRASSNRSNVFYLVRQANPQHGSLLEQSAAEVRDAWEVPGLFDHAVDKVLIYVRTREEAAKLSDLLGCDMCTSESGALEEKEQTLRRWTGSPSCPFLVATTALAEGFDYPHVRLVLNVDEPDSLVIFAQQSGRAGRDGRKAYSFVLLPAAWKPSSQCEGDLGAGVTNIRDDLSLAKQREKRAVHTYLRGEQCFRTSLSECLDAPQHRRWCMPQDVPCDVCGVGHTEPIGLQLMTDIKRDQRDHTGFDAIQKNGLRLHNDFTRYKEGLTALQGTCLLCRALNLRWDHEFSVCGRRHEVFDERMKARRRHEARGKTWLQAYTACYWCLNPQMLCSRADPKRCTERENCEYGDLILPICHGVFQSASGPAWLLQQFGRQFGSVEGFYDWLGEKSQFGGCVAIQAVRVAAEAISWFGRGQWIDK